MKPTPGPWRAQKTRGKQHTIDRKWEIVAPINGGGEQVVVGEHSGIDCLTAPNARLIAAAPDLLAACDMIAGQCMIAPDAGEHELRERIRQIAHIALTACAKAKP